VKAAALGSNDSTSRAARDEERRESREQPDADAGGEADGERGQHDTGVLRIVDLRPVGTSPRADDAERARLDPTTSMTTAPTTAG
jgi:hypothetical protein